MKQEMNALRKSRRAKRMPTGAPQDHEEQGCPTPSPGRIWISVSYLWISDRQ